MVLECSGVKSTHKKLDTLIDRTMDDTGLMVVTSPPRASRIATIWDWCRLMVNPLFETGRCWLKSDHLSHQGLRWPLTPPTAVVDGAKCERGYR